MPIIFATVVSKHSYCICPSVLLNSHYRYINNYPGQSNGIWDSMLKMYLHRYLCIMWMLYAENKRNVRAGINEGIKVIPSSGGRKIAQCPCSRFKS